MTIELYQQEVTVELMDLLLMADPGEEAIAGYIDDSSIFVAYDSHRMIGVAVLAFEKEKAELMNLAVEESCQGRGVAKELIFKAQDFAKECGVLSMQVKTGNSSLSQIALYQKCGFRMQSIEQGHFQEYPEPIYENGIRCLDRVVLCAKL